MSAIPVSYIHGRLCHQSQHLHTHQVPSFTNLVLCFHTFSGPSLLECREVMIESWELSVTVLMYQCPGLWPAISILCIGCVIARARPPTQGELTIGARSLQFMHVDGWVVWSQCSCKPKIANQKCGFVFQQHNKSVKFHFTTTPMLMIPGSC